eukprot:CAMPEP_0206328100 /NCGR_PEP_ID=MMETSP0106_2-20121207/22501_1 /ASSEMBLY_ACC=CAM_ASM_000206 /TAXON_ID=81532 /ORGANISM="Acanthoeca-like sp., Strain 10tr" /LENGTH=95 /DNA_ID=CAMNT_0053760761 /DNA_START=368 /DNA_END=655 /DNA_ORIENTATION=+
MKRGTSAGCFANERRWKNLIGLIALGKVDAAARAILARGVCGIRLPAERTSASSNSLRRGSSPDTSRTRGMAAFETWSETRRATCQQREFGIQPA